MHSVTRYPGEDFDVLHVMSASYRTDSIEELELAVDDLTAALEDAQVHLTFARRAELDEPIPYDEALAAEFSYGRYAQEPDGPIDLDWSRPEPPNWEP